MKHPRLITALGIMVLVLAFAIPTALASNPNTVPGGNCGHQACRTTRTTEITSTVPVETTSVVTIPYVTTQTVTITNSTETVSTSTAAGRVCNPNGATAPPCGKNKSFTTPGSGISVGLVLVVLGMLTLGYLWIHRRRTLKLED